MKKLLMALALLPLMTAAETITYLTEQNYQDGGVILTGVESGTLSGALDIPSTYNGQTVTGIGGKIFEAKYVPSAVRIESVSIPASVKTIGKKAFCGCTLLKQVILNEGLRTIGKGAFEGCPIDEVVIPASVMEIEDNVFGMEINGGKSMIGVAKISVMPSNPRFKITSDGLLYDFVDKKVLAAAKGVTRAVIPDDCEIIGESALGDQLNLAEVVFPRSLRRIECKAFSWTALKAVDLSDTQLEFLGCEVFWTCRNLMSVKLPITLGTIGCYHSDDPPFGMNPNAAAVGWRMPTLTISFAGRIPELICDFCNPADAAKIRILVQPEMGWENEVRMGKWQGCSIRYAGTSPLDGPFELLPGEVASIDTGLIGYTAKGLPSGLKYNKTTGMITGAATKPTAAEGVVVKFTKRNEPEAEMKIVVGPMPTLSISLVGDTEKCKVKGAGAYLVGKKVSLSATAPKGTAFVGWFANGAPWPNAEESKNAKLSYVMTKADVSLVAKFEKEQMSVGCAGLEGRGFTVGVAGGAGIPLEIETQSGVKSVKVSKLPAGMKYNAKTGLIEGAPTKAGDYTVQIAVTAKSGAVETKDIAIRVDPLPDWAVGTFEGAVRQIDYDADGNVVFDGEDLHNWYDIVATVSVDTKGKISGKLTFPDKKTFVLKLNALTAVEPGICIAEGDVMVKRQRYAVRAVFGAGSFQFADGVVTMGRCDLSIILQGQPTTCFRTDADRPLVQTFWSRKELKGRALQMGLTAKSGFDVENATGEDVEFSGVVKVSDKGVAKLTCTVNGAKSTASGTLLPVGPDVADGFAASVSIKISRTSFRAVKLLFVPTAEGWVVKAVCW